MTILNTAETERIISHDPVQLWDVIQRDWAGDDQHRWKMLVCIHLRLHCRWGLEMIGLALGHHKGHILRLINTGLCRLRQWHTSVQYEPATAAGESESPYALSLDEIAQRRAFFLDEVELWTKLFEEAGRSPSQTIVKHSPRRRIVPGSVRDRISRFLRNDGPAHWSAISRRLVESEYRVRQVLVCCPEFVCNRHGLWTVHPFAGLEVEEMDTEWIASTDEVPA